VYVLAGVGTLGTIMVLLAVMNRPAGLDPSGADFEQDPTVMRIMKEMESGQPGS
jgi:hypothetical protein